MYRYQGLEDIFYGTMTVGDRGQVVIPKQARDDFGIESGDKIMFFSGHAKIGLGLVKIDKLRMFLDMLPKWIEEIEKDIDKEGKPQ